MLVDNSSQKPWIDEAFYAGSAYMSAEFLDQEKLVQFQDRVHPALIQTISCNWYKNTGNLHTFRRYISL